MFVCVFDPPSPFCASFCRANDTEAAALQALHRLSIVRKKYIYNPEFPWLNGEKREKMTLEGRTCSIQHPRVCARLESPNEHNSPACGDTLISSNRAMVIQDNLILLLFSEAFSLCFFRRLFFLLMSQDISLNRSYSAAYICTPPQCPHPIPHHG